MQVVDSSGFPQNPVEGTLFAKNYALYVYRIQDGIGFWFNLVASKGHYQHSQPSVTQIWSITHNFNLDASEIWVQVIDRDGNLLSGVFDNGIDNNTLIITLATASNGYALLIPKVNVKQSLIEAEQISVGLVSISVNGITVAGYPVLTTETITPDKIGAISKDALGVAGGVASLNFEGVVPKAQLPDSIPYTVNGKLDPLLWPDAKVFMANSELQMLSLPATVGDFALRPDISATFVLAEPQANMLTAWWKLPTPGALVESVNGQTGVVSVVNITGNAETARKLLTSRIITLEGVIKGAIAFDGNADVKLITYPDQLHRVAETGSWNDLINRPVIPSSTSALVNDSGFVSASQIPVVSVNGQTGNVVIPAYELPTATATRLGGVRQGANVTIAGDGTISAQLTADSLVAGVASVNGRDGAVLLQLNDITFALGFTPYDAANPQQFQTLSQVLSLVADAALPVATDNVLGGVKQGDNVVIESDGRISALPSGVTSFQGRSGDIFVTYNDIRSALASYPPDLFNEPLQSVDNFFDLEPEQLESLSIRVWMWQLKYALIDIDMYETVETYLNDLTEPTVRLKALAKWNNAPTIAYGSDISDLLQEALAYDDTEMKQLFITANALLDTIED